MRGSRAACGGGLVVDRKLPMVTRMGSYPATPQEPRREPVNPHKTALWGQSLCWPCSVPSAMKTGPQARQRPALYNQPAWGWSPGPSHGALVPRGRHPGDWGGDCATSSLLAEEGDCGFLLAHSPAALSEPSLSLSPREGGDASLSPRAPDALQGHGRE